MLMLKKSPEDQYEINNLYLKIFKCLLSMNGDFCRRHSEEYLREVDRLSGHEQYAETVLSGLIWLMHFDPPVCQKRIFTFARAIRRYIGARDEVIQKLNLILFYEVLIQEELAINPIACFDSDLELIAQHLMSYAAMTPDDVSQCREQWEREGLYEDLEQQESHSVDSEQAEEKNERFWELSKRELAIKIYEELLRLLDDSQTKRLLNVLVHNEKRNEEVFFLFMCAVYRAKKFSELESFLARYQDVPVE